MSKNILLAAILLVMSAVFATAQSAGMLKKKVPRGEYGNVIINNFSEKKNIAPVVFNHWLHRAKYTCRLCHIDIGFAMQAGGTKMTEADNNKGLYCGACHNGKEAFAAEEKKLAGLVVRPECDRCHSYGKKVDFHIDFSQFTEDFPKSRFGNGVDWISAEKQGFVKVKDYLEGFSIKGKSLSYAGETELKAQAEGMPDIIFSHKKHAVWNGCELCHPDVFGVKKGATKYSMQEIFEGKYCGVCHGKVAFPSLDCKLCHSKEVM